MAEQDEVKTHAELIEAVLKQYHEAAHAVQTGIAYLMQSQPRLTAPKDLRVGINLTKCEISALVYLLIEKGLFTEIEYYNAMLAKTLDEVRMLEEQLEKAYGTAKVTLA